MTRVGFNVMYTMGRSMQLRNSKPDSVRMFRHPSHKPDCVHPIFVCSFLQQPLKVYERKNDRLFAAEDVWMASRTSCHAAASDALRQPVS